MTEPLYASLAGQLRERIRSGEFRPGDRLPSERELGVSTGVARGTVIAALRALAAEGIVVSTPRVGYVVRAMTRLPWVATTAERNPDTDVSPSDTWSRSVREAGLTPSELITVEIVRADDELASRLALDVGDPVVARRRVRSVDGAPYMIADSYYSESVVRGTPIAVPGDILPGVYRIFEELGHPWSPTKRDFIITRPPTSKETQTLDILPDTWVLRVGRLSTSVTGLPVRYSVFVLPGDRAEIEYEFEEEL